MRGCNDHDVLNVNVQRAACASAMRAYVAQSTVAVNENIEYRSSMCFAKTVDFNFSSM
jgi:hypothetical protein